MGQFYSCFEDMGKDNKKLSLQVVARSQGILTSPISHSNQYTTFLHPSHRAIRLQGLS